LPAADGTHKDNRGDVERTRKVGGVGPEVLGAWRLGKLLVQSTERAGLVWQTKTEKCPCACTNPKGLHSGHEFATKKTATEGVTNCK